MQIPGHNGLARAPKRDWTVLYVLDGDNDLREAATLDMVELDKSGAPENVNVAAQLYRGELKWNLQNLSKKARNLFKPEPPPAVNPDWRGVKTFEVRHQGTSEQTTTVGTPDTAGPSDPKSLENMVAWAMEKYPSEHFALVLTGHGGPDGLLSDSEGRKMPFAEVSTALKAASQRSGQEVDVVLFDTCSTASEETARAMQGSAKFLVAAPGKINGKGWSEVATMDFLKNHSSAGPREFAQSFLAPVHGVDEPVLYQL